MILVTIRDTRGNTMRMWGWPLALVVGIPVVAAVIGAPVGDAILLAFLVGTIMAARRVDAAEYFAQRAGRAGGIASRGWKLLSLMFSVLQVIPGVLAAGSSPAPAMQRAVARHEDELRDRWDEEKARSAANKAH
jgi:hypothetical protein